jgi:hypothetical protein
MKHFPGLQVLLLQPVTTTVIRIKVTRVSTISYGAIIYRGSHTPFDQFCRRDTYHTSNLHHAHSDSQHSWQANITLNLYYITIYLLYPFNKSLSSYYEMSLDILCLVNIIPSPCNCITHVKMSPVNLISKWVFKYDSHTKRRFPHKFWDVHVSILWRCNKCLHNTRDRFWHLLWSGWILFLVCWPTSLQIPLRDQKCAEKVDTMDWPNDFQQVLKISLHFVEILCSCKKQKQHSKIS